MRAATPAARQKRSDKLIKNDHNETGPLVRATHVHYVSVSAGLWLEYIKGFWIEEEREGGAGWLEVKGQLHPRLMTPQTD